MARSGSGHPAHRSSGDGTLPGRPEPGGETGRITDALCARLPAELSPVVRAGIVFAIAELAREHDDPHGAARTHARWSDSAQPTQVRVASALAWLCLVDDPVPNSLHTPLDTLITDDLACLLDTVAWTAHVDDEKGLARTLDQLLNDAEAGVIDPGLRG